ncbi:MAG: helix-turn-helix transcriptional regulator [Defluviitaleaceae bacterium]|nr:helix-turn-helix transcriptional regulator [Defluviitaleaceae bacterium]
MTKANQKEMANRIKKRREALGFTQESFCETIGLSASSYTKIENAFQRPALDTLIKIAENLDLSLDYIVFGDNRPKKVLESEIINAIVQNTDGEKLLYASKLLAQIAKIIPAQE